MRISDLPLVIQTSYAELLDQLRLAAVSEYPTGSTFRKRTISGRDYWYVQEPTGPAGRPPESYIGPDNEERRALVDAAKRVKADADSRKAIRRALTGAGLPEPDSLTGAVIEALAEAGVFRLRGVIVGTVAFQTYAGLLGIKLPNASVRTGDLDVAQDYGISVNLDDALETSLLEVLQSVDPDFQAVPSLAGPNVAATYSRPGGYRVDVLTTNRGADRDAPVRLPTLKSDAVALRYLDFLLTDTIEAAVLSRSGALVNVPAPERYAVHKLIVSVMRRTTGESAIKSDKDIIQAGLLIETLIAKRRADDLSDVFQEAAARGDSWRSSLLKAATKLDGDAADFVRSQLSK